ncbi:MAG: YdcH family protein [Alphaproteobacteria bacterium]|jgi:hypothetical protein|nr:YdcH family protein [Alphaproteobacteria bacterium]
MSEARQAEALVKRHAELDRQLEDEQARPKPDSEIIAELKRQKLALKDQLQDA